jgi:hypothetical protein
MRVKMVVTRPQMSEGIAMGTMTPEIVRAIDVK